MASRTLTQDELERNIEERSNGSTPPPKPIKALLGAKRGREGFSGPKHGRQSQSRQLTPGRTVVDVRSPFGLVGLLGAIVQDAGRDEQTLQAIKLIRDNDPQASQATWNLLRLLNPGHDLKALVFGPDGSEIEEAGQAQNYLNGLAASVGVEYGGGLDQLLAVLGLMAITYGAVALEVAPTAGLNDIEDWYPIEPTQLVYRREPDPSNSKVTFLQLGQEVAGIFEPINVEQVFFQPLDPDVESPYGRPPLLPAIQAVIASWELLRDVQRYAHNQGYPRIDIKVIWELVVKNAPPQLRDNPESLNEWAGAQLAQVVSDYDELDVDDTFFHFDWVTVETMEAGAAFDFSGLEQILARRVNQSLKTLPVLVGFNESTSETHGSIQWQIQVAGIENFRRLLKRVIERASNVSLQLAGFQAHAKLTFKEIRTVDRLYEAQSDFFDRRNAQMDRQEGYVTQDEAAQAIVGHAAEGGLPADIAKGLFDLCQLLLATGVDAVTALAVSQGAGGLVPPEVVEELKAQAEAAEAAAAAANLPAQPVSTLPGPAPEPAQTMEPPTGEAGQGKQAAQFKLPDGKVDPSLAWTEAWRSAAVQERSPILQALTARRLRAAPPRRRAARVPAYQQVNERERIERYAEAGEQAFRALESDVLDLLDAEGFVDRVEGRDPARDIAATFARQLARQMKPLLRDALLEGALLAELTGEDVIPGSLVDRIWRRNQPYIRKIADNLRDDLRAGRISTVDDVAEWFANHSWRERLMGRHLGKQGLSAGYAFAKARLGLDRFRWQRTIEESCPTCTERGGQLYTYEEMLAVGFPGSDQLDCGANCRCLLVPLERGES